MKYESSRSYERLVGNVQKEHQGLSKLLKFLIFTARENHFKPINGITQQKISKNRRVIKRSTLRTRLKMIRKFQKKNTQIL